MNFHMQCRFCFPLSNRSRSHAGPVKSPPDKDTKRRQCQPHQGPFTKSVFLTSRTCLFRCMYTLCPVFRKCLSTCSLPKAKKVFMQTQSPPSEFQKKRDRYSISQAYMANRSQHGDKGRGRKTSGAYEVWHTLLWLLPSAAILQWLHSHPQQQLPPRRRVPGTARQPSTPYTQRPQEINLLARLSKMR